MQVWWEDTHWWRFSSSAGLRSVSRRPASPWPQCCASCRPTRWTGSCDWCPRGASGPRCTGRNPWRAPSPSEAWESERNRETFDHVLLAGKEAYFMTIKGDVVFGLYQSRFSCLNVYFRHCCSSITHKQHHYTLKTDEHEKKQNRSSVRFFHVFNEQHKPARQPEPRRRSAGSFPVWRFPRWSNLSLLSAETQTSADVEIWRERLHRASATPAAAAWNTDRNTSINVKH